MPRSPQADADPEQAAEALLARTQLAVDQMDGDRHTPPTDANRPGRRPLTVSRSRPRRPPAGDRPR